MSREQIFLIMAVGLTCGIYLGVRLARNDRVGYFGWTAAGAIPGAALLAAEPNAMWTLAALLPLLVWRYLSKSRPTSAG
jgi:hypothetical protein